MKTFLYIALFFFVVGVSNCNSGSSKSDDTTAQAICSEGWCWLHPYPHSGQINQVFALNENQIWLVGTGPALKWDGNRFNQLYPPDIGDHADVWAFSDSDVWLVGSEAIAHWNGSSWEKNEDVKGRSIAAFSTKEIYVADSARSKVYLYNGKLWNAAASNTAINNLVTDSDQTMFGSFTSSSTVYQWQDSQFRSLPNLPGFFASGAVLDLAIDSEGRLWAVGGSSNNTSDPLLAYFENETWTSLADGAPEERILSIHPISKTNFYISTATAIFHYDGETYSTIESTTEDHFSKQFFALAKLADDSFIAGGRMGRVAKFANGQLNYLSSDPLFLEDINAAWIGTNGSVWLANEEIIGRWHGLNTYHREAKGELTALYGNDSGEFWAVNNEKKLIKNGPEQTTETYEDLDNVNSNRMWGSSINDIWLAGGNTFAHFDGTTWTSGDSLFAESGPSRMLDVWGLSDGRVFVLGNDNSIWQFADSEWSKQSDASEHSYQHLLPTDDGCVFLHDSSSVFRLNAEQALDQEWNIVGSTGDLITAIHAGSCDNVWALSKQGLAWQWNGTETKTIEIEGSDRHFIRTRIINANALYAVTKGSELLRPQTEEETSRQQEALNTDEN